MPEQDIGGTQFFAEHVDFGKTSSDYRKFRLGFPDEFFDSLCRQLDLHHGQHAIDVGTGTGTLARGLAKRGLNVVGVDPSPDLMREAVKLDNAEGVTISYRVGRAESLEFEDCSVDLVTAGQCWHWFDRRQAAVEMHRVLRPDGKLVIAHFDWLPLPGNVVEATEELILKANPSWTMAGGTGLYPDWLADMSCAGFTDLETRSFDVVQPYSHEAWRGRIRASAGVKASLDETATAKFDAELRALLDKSFSEDPLAVPHRAWWVAGKKR